MKKWYLILNLFFITIVFCKSQVNTFNKMYLPNGVYQSGANNIILTDTGYILPGWAPPGIITFTNIDLIGNYICSKNFVWPVASSFGQGDNNIIQKDSFFYSIGYTQESDRYSSFVAKHNLNFDTVFFKEFHVDTLYSGSSDFVINENQLVITGWAVFDGEFEDLIIYSVDFDGNIIWYKHYGGSSGDYGECIEKSFDNGYLVGGKSHSYGTESSFHNGDWYLIKTDSIGNMQWYKRYGNPEYNDQHIFDICKTIDSCYLICGMYAVEPLSTTTVNKSRLIKIDQSGNIIWSKLFGYLGTYNKMNRIKQKENGDIYTLSLNDSMGDTGLKYIAQCLTKDGDVKWRRNFYFNLNQETVISFLDDFELTNDGGLILTGTGASEALTPMQYTWAIKTDSLGFDGIQCYEDTVLNISCFQDTVCFSDSIKLFFKITGKSAPYQAVYSNGTTHDSLFYPDTYEDYIMDSAYFYPTVINDYENISVVLTDPWGNSIVKFFEVYIDDCDIGIIDNKSDDIVIFPIPCSKFVFIESTKPSILNLSVYDIDGRKLLETNITIGMNRLNVEGIKPGIYYFFLKDAETTVIKKIVIEK